MRTARRRALRDQLIRFALVGGVGFVLDLALFNVLSLTVLSPDRIHEGPLIAKTLSTSVAIVANWLGNRYWTFGPHRSSRNLREAAEFVAVSLLGMGIGLACLWLSRYVLGFDNAVADNVSGNVIGLLLGSIVRFTLYRYWVYNPGRKHRVHGSAERAEESPVPS